jgi:hypothetical protein
LSAVESLSLVEKRAVVPGMGWWEINLSKMVGEGGEVTQNLFFLEIGYVGDATYAG